MCLATRNMIAEHRDAALFGSGRTTIGENDLSEIYSMVDNSMEMQEDISSKVEALQEEIKEMDESIDKAEHAVSLAIKAIEANKMPKAVRVAVLQVLQHAANGVGDLRKSDIKGCSERIAELVSDSW